MLGARGELHGALRAHGARVGAGSAADAQLRCERGEQKLLDADSLCRAYAAALAARDALGVVHHGDFLAALCGL